MKSDFVKEICNSEKEALEAIMAEGTTIILRVLQETDCRLVGIMRPIFDHKHNDYGIIMRFNIPPTETEVATMWIEKRPTEEEICTEVRLSNPWDSDYMQYNRGPIDKIHLLTEPITTTLIKSFPPERIGPDYSENTIICMMHDFQKTELEFIKSQSVDRLDGNIIVNFDRDLHRFASMLKLSCKGQHIGNLQIAKTDIYHIQLKWFDDRNNPIETTAENALDMPAKLHAMSWEVIKTYKDHLNG